MSRLWIGGCVVLAAVIGLPLARGATTSVATLAELARQGAWAELLERAETIAPQDRTEEWRRLVARAAAERTLAFSTTRPGWPTVQAALDLEARYAVLGPDADFKRAVSTSVADAAATCLHLPDPERDACVRPLAVHESRLSAADAMRIARFLAGVYRPIGVLRLINRALPVADAATCREEMVWRAIDAALELPPRDERVAIATRVAFDVCWNDLAKSLRASMIGASTYRLHNTCAPLRAKHALTAIQDELCKDEGR